MAPRISSWPIWNNVLSTDRNIRSADGWIEARRKEDGADGLWRVYDGLYDLNQWTQKHPGGSQWLTITRGTDITELFETYHFNQIAVTEVMRKFYVRRAEVQRKSPFTFKSDGFYNVLKSRVKKKLSKINRRDVSIKSVLVIDTWFFATLLLCTAVAQTQSTFLAFLAGISLALGTVASHNFTHLKDNWRMYYMHLSMFSVREWRISHVISHHIYTNTVHDLEMTLLHPFIHWFPTDDKPPLVRCVPYLTLLVYPLIAPGQFVIRTSKRINDRADLLIFVIPVVLMICGRMTIGSVFNMWLIIILTSSFVFSFLGFSVSHHFPNNFHDGDHINDKEDIDWGLHQMDTSAERNEIADNIFVTLVTFSDHTLHHLFPALDQSLIPFMKDIFQETCKEFGLDTTLKPFASIIRGQFKQLVRLTPNHPKRKKCFKS